MSGTGNGGSPFSVLVFTKTCGFRHDSIPAGVAAMKRLAAQSSPSNIQLPVGSNTAADSPLFDVVHSEDAEACFTPAALSRFRVVMLLQASGAFLDGDQLGALRAFVDGGGGVVAVHCASHGIPPGSAADPEGWYVRVLVGACFTEHPVPQDGRVVAEDPGHPILAAGGGRALRAFCPASSSTGTGEEELEWRLHEEWYNFRANPRQESAGADGKAEPVHVLLRADESSYEGGKLGHDHPIAWCRELETGGRTFYTALGHFDEAYSDETFMGQILNAILWTAKVI